MAPGPLSDAEIELSVVSGDTQTGDPGLELGQPLIVLVTDERGHPIRDHLVNFRVAEGGGSVFAGAANTDRHGVAADWWTLGLRGPQTVEVRTVSSDGVKHTYAEFRATLNFEVPLPSEDLDGDGHTEPDDCDDTDSRVNPDAEDRPDESFVDSNCDGIDGDIALSVFVSPAGTDGGLCGAMDAPCLSIEAGLLQARVLGRRDVLLAQGVYDETVSLVSGVNLYGGHSADFSARDALAFEVVITGGSGGHAFNSGREPISVLANAITAATEVADLTILGVDATGTVGGAGRNSYALLVNNVGPELLTITRTRIVGGNGSTGVAGSSGSNAPQSRAEPGRPGVDEVDAGGMLCSTGFSFGGGGGGSSFGNEGGNGGLGGSMHTQCGGPFGIPLDADPRAGTAGSAGARAGAPGGSGGQGGAPCFPGLRGDEGSTQNGSSGNGGSGGAVTGPFWQSGAGAAGSLGLHGGGGGGGGGAGGCNLGADTRGASGGGGGAGGLRAPQAGSGGTGGGASFVVYLINASPRLVANQLVRGSGGAGGRGGAGTLGQPGGLGGLGGSRFDHRAGGNGGDGGDGGDSGAGGGGAGGISVAIASVGGIPFTSDNVISGGSGGAGGPGGLPGGGAGVMGALLEQATF